MSCVLWASMDVQRAVCFTWNMEVCFFQDSVNNVEILNVCNIVKRNSKILYFQLNNTFLCNKNQKNIHNGMSTRTR